MFAYGYRRRQRNLSLDYTKLKACQNHSTVTSWAKVSGGLQFGELILTPFLLYIVSRIEFHVCPLAQGNRLLFALAQTPLCLYLSDVEGVVLMEKCLSGHLSLPDFVL